MDYFHVQHFRRDSCASGKQPGTPVSILNSNFLCVFVLFRVDTWRKWIFRAGTWYGGVARIQLFTSIRMESISTVSMHSNRWNRALHREGVEDRLWIAHIFHYMEWSISSSMERWQRLHKIANATGGWEKLRSPYFFGAHLSDVTNRFIRQQKGRIEAFFCAGQRGTIEEAKDGNCARQHWTSASKYHLERR